MEKGYDVFGKAYSIMLRNDLHDINSIDHKFMQEMILLNDESYTFLYGNKPKRIDMREHELYFFAKQFIGKDDRETVENTLKFTSKIAMDCCDNFNDMKFGGTEKEIIERGTDWCADLARVGAVLLACNDISARIVHLVNPYKAYNGHVVVEAYYEGKYGICDFVYGYCFYNKEPLDAHTLKNNKELLASYPLAYSAMYSAIAINEYNPMDCNNDYTISSPNSYYLNLIETNHKDEWIMGEDL